MNCVIIVPVYRLLANNFEVQSFSSACRVCSLDDRISICVITYKGMDLESFYEIGRKYKVSIDVSYFNRLYFRDIHGYNKLMLDARFYKSFSSYDYMLICQLDAILFKDNLINWCMMGYDYIGAPIFSNNHKRSFDYAVVGNGGLSLRKVSKFISSLTESISFRELTMIRWPDHPKYTIIRRFLYFVMLYSIGRIRALLWFLTYWVAEDLFYSFVLSCSRHELCRPEVKEAVKFSFDLDHAFLYDYLKPEMPFGVHRWNAGNAEIRSNFN